jgi:hypothetical protein
MPAYREGLGVVRLFDGTFVAGTVLVILAVALAGAALVRDDLPVVGSGVGALLAVAVLGMAACAVAGISQAPALGWTAPGIVLGIVVGVVALVVVGAGVFGWSAILQPVAGLVPGRTTAPADVRVAIFALAGLIGLKWIVGVAMAAANR